MDRSEIIKAYSKRTGRTHRSTNHSSNHSTNHSTNHDLNHAMHQESMHESEKSSYGFRETLVLQSIICGIIMAVVLSICLINTDFTKNLRQDLVEIIHSEWKVSDINNTFDNILGYFTNEKAPALAESDDSGNVIELDADEVIAPKLLTEIKPKNPYNDVDFRIDEDILEDIRSKNDPYIQDTD